MELDNAISKNYQHITISGNARVHLGDHIASDPDVQKILAATALLQEAKAKDNSDLKARADAKALLVSRERVLMEWLQFPRMTSRKESVRDTHATTFEWIVQKQELARRPDLGFRRWLEHGTGIYWIAGKAGSGKSTLMKLISQHIETWEALRVWARGMTLICPSFYFWYRGTQMQRSQLGMLRSLVHELLRTNQDLIPTVFPLWTEKCASMEPEYHELKAALREILLADKRKICLFIDGLDEYEGDSVSSAALADYLSELVGSSSNVKIVVSSRPLQEFERHVDSWPHFMLQDLTAPDILLYVEDKLRKNQRMIDLERRDRASTAILFNELVNRASGVFLWIHVVVRSLLDGLQSYDTVPDLMARVLELPSELDELFDVMLQRISERYRPQAFRLLWIAHELLSYDTGHDGAPALIVSCADEFGAMKHTGWKETSTSVTDLKERQARIQAVVRSRCLGLLECGLGHSYQACFGNIAYSHVISYIHRSVSEYLNRINIGALAQRIPGPDFDVNVGIIRAVAISAGHGKHRTGEKHNDALIKLFSQFNRRAERSVERAQSEAVTELDQRLTKARNDPLTYLSYSADHWSESYLSLDQTVDSSYQGLAFATHFGWELYVTENLNQYNRKMVANPTLRMVAKPLLHYAVPSSVAQVSTESGAHDVYVMSISITRNLLEHGEDPNEEYDGTSPWINAIRFLSGFRDGTNIVTIVEIMKALVEYGANPEAECSLKTLSKGKKGFTADDVVRDCLQADELSQEEQNALQELLAMISANHVKAPKEIEETPKEQTPTMLASSSPNGITKRLKKRWKRLLA